MCGKATKDTAKGGSVEEKSETHSTIEGIGALQGGYPRGSIFDRVGVVHRGGNSDVPGV